MPVYTRVKVGPFVYVSRADKRPWKSLTRGQGTAILALLMIAFPFVAIGLVSLLFS